MLISEKPGIWARQWEQEGIQKGRKEGMQAGQAALLERLLIRKFGPLPDVLVQRIQQGTASELEAWSLNFVEANSLEQVFTGTA